VGEVVVEDERRAVDGRRVADGVVRVHGEYLAEGMGR
jgi:hypothetical protein